MDKVIPLAEANAREGHEAATSEKTISSEKAVILPSATTADPASSDALKAMNTVGTLNLEGSAAPLVQAPIEPVPEHLGRLLTIGEEQVIIEKLATAHGPSVGRKFGRFDIVSVLGVGGFTVVFEAYDRLEQQAVALKVPRPDRHVSQQSAQRLIREIAQLRRVRHPNVVDVYYALEVSGRLAIVMELVGKRTLRDWLRDTKELRPLETVMGLVFQIADGLEAAHALGIVHRDLKPENLIVRPLGAGQSQALKIVDFNIAQLKGDSGLVEGTPPYASPEQMSESGTVSAQHDVHALSVVAFELLTGRLPKVDGPSPSSLRADTPPELDRVLYRGMDGDPKRRFASIAELRSAISEAIAPASIFERAKALYDNGRGSPENWIEARRLVTIAAEAGRPVAARQLGEMLRKGHGGEIDAVEARRWMTAAAQAGDPRAMTLLGEMLQDGVGGDKDERAALDWFRAASEAGDQIGGFWWGTHLLKVGPTPEDRSTGLAIVEKVAEAGHPIAMMYCASTYYYGDQVKKDKVRARRWMRAAARADDPAAMYHYGQMLMDGDGGDRDESSAGRWIKRAAKAGHVPAMTSFGIALSRGKLVAQDHAAAKLWFEEAAKHDDVRALYHLGRCYRIGIGTKANSTLARQFLERAAGLGYSYAMYELGDLLRDTDSPASKGWVAKAAEAGHREAIEKCLADALPESQELQLELALFDFAVERFQQGRAKGDDLDKAGAAFSLLEDKNVIEAWRYLGLCLIQGGGRVFKHDPVLGVSIVERAAEAGDIPAMLFLARETADERTALDAPSKGWLKKAADAGSSDAMLLLADRAEGAERRDWLELAASKDSPEAMRQLALVYSEGVGVRRDYQKAAEWRIGAARAENKAESSAIDDAKFVHFTKRIKVPGAKAISIAFGMERGTVVLENFDFPAEEGAAADAAPDDQTEAAFE